MKKVLLGLGLLILLLLASLIAVPFLFKDKIKVLLDQQIANQVNADVRYQSENVDLTVFRHFPNLTLAIDELAIIGQDTFARDTLAYLPALELNLDIMSVISGNEIKVNSVELQRPFINLIVTKGGKANWDIMKPSAETDTMPATESDMKLALEGWKINEGRIIYTDNTLPFVADLKNVNHSGSGDFEKNVFDMQSKTTAEQFTMKYGGVPYLNKVKLDADVTMGMDLNNAVYTFKENQIKLNDFLMGFAGNIAMPTEDIALDLTFNTKDADFKSLLSLVPGMYADNFEKVKTEGKMSFQGFLKGVSSETSVPGYGVDVQVQDAMFQYPDLPQAARNIAIDMSVKNPDGQDQSLNVDVRKFHLDLGKNPVDATVKIQGLAPMLVDGNVKAKINLEEITKVVPVEGMTLRGLLNVDATAKGTYSETQMPVTQAILALTDGYVKSKDFPAPIEQLTVNGVVNNATGQANDTRINIERFKMLLDGEPLEGRVSVIGLDKSLIDADIKGTLDLTKLTKIFPLEDMTVAGRINADVKANFNMADIEAERYGNVKMSGNTQINNLNFVSKDLPQGMKIAKADMTFNNEQLQVKEMNGSLGKSDFQANGILRNYLGYALEENQSLKGTLSVNSNRFDVNEWMVEE
ncbi:MAG: AsmA family protein, partial [Sphingobacteriales bacterium]